MVFAKEVIRQEACESTNDSSSRQRRTSLFRAASLRSQTVSAKSSSSSSPKASSPPALGATSKRPPLVSHQNSRLRRQTSLRAFDQREGAGKPSIQIGLPVKKGRISLGQRAEAHVDEFGVVAATTAPELREKAATASSTLPLFSRRHSVSRPPTCTVSTASSSTTKTLTKHSCFAEVKTHHSRLSSTSSATVTVPSSSRVQPRLRTCSSTPTKVTVPRRDLRQQKGDTAGYRGCKATTSSTSGTSQLPKIKTLIIESKDAKNSRSSFQLPLVNDAEGSMASRSPNTPTPTNRSKVETPSDAVPWAKWDGQQGHLEDGGNVHEQDGSESSTGLDLLDLTVGSQLLLEGDELEEMLKAEIDVLGFMDHSSSTILKSSPPRVTLPTAGDVVNETVSSTVHRMQSTDSQQKMEIITLERDEAVRQWQNSQGELSQIQPRLAELEAAAAAADEQDIKRAEKAALIHHHRHTAPMMENATSQTEARDDVVNSADDTLTETVRRCRVENVREGWRYAAQMANQQIEVLHMQASVTGYLMDQLNQLERSLLSTSSSSYLLLHSNDKASAACSGSS